MFAVILTYRVDFPQIDPHVGAHLEWLDRGYAAGHFVMSGRRQPRTGGVIIARQMDRSSLDRILDSDPFRQHGLADYDIVEFVASKVHPDFAGLQESA